MGSSKRRGLGDSCARERIKTAWEGERSREGNGKNHRKIGFGFKSNTVGIESSTWPVGLGVSRDGERHQGSKWGMKRI